MKSAAIDIGTNSCRLLITEKKGKNLAHIHKEIITTRIGEGVNRSGIISDMAMARTIQGLKQFKNQLDKLGVEKYRAIATSAVREAENRDQFIERAGRESNIKVEIASEEEEASLSYLGVVSSLDFSRTPLVVDLGGGSTEIICLNEKERFWTSIPIGAVRASECELSVYDINEILAPLKKAKDSFAEHPLVFVGGTASSLVAIKLAMEVYDPDIVHGQILKKEEVLDLYNLLEKLPLKLRQSLPGLQAERADIICKGVLIILVLMKILAKDKLIVSEADLLIGIINSI